MTYYAQRSVCFASNCVYFAGKFAGPGALALCANNYVVRRPVLERAQQYPVNLVLVVVVLVVNLVLVVVVLVVNLVLVVVVLVVLKTTLCVGQVRCSFRKRAKTMATLRKKMQDFHKGKNSK